MKNKAEGDIKQPIPLIAGTIDINRSDALTP